MKANHIGLPALVPALYLLGISGPLAAAEAYDIAFSTYLGGQKWEQARDVCTDAAGNIYVVGCVTSSEKEGFPVTAGTFGTVFPAGGKYVGSLGSAAGFAAKFSPDGRLVWCTYLGGPNYNRFYSVELDPEGNLVLAGRAGPGFPTTPGAFQPSFTGDLRDWDALYGAQNAVALKLSSDGKRVLWASYVGVNPGFCSRGMTVDDQGDVYVTMGVIGQPPMLPAWMNTDFAHAFQKTRGGGKSDLAVVKIKGDGSRVLWATWVSGDGEEWGQACVRVDQARNVFLGTSTDSKNMPVTGCCQDTNRGGLDAYYAKISPDGSRLLYGTYLGGGDSDQGNEANSLFVDAAGNAYATVLTRSADFPVTADRHVFDTTYHGSGDVAVIKLSPTGQLLLSTFIGSSGGEKVEGMTVERAGRVIFGGFTTGDDFPCTPTTLQKIKGPGRDAFFCVLSADFRTLDYATYIGGVGDQAIRGSHVDSNGVVYVIGSASGGWPTVNAFQKDYAGANDTRWCNGDCVLMKLMPRR